MVGYMEKKTEMELRNVQLLSSAHHVQERLCHPKSCTLHIIEQTKAGAPLYILHGCIEHGDALMCHGQARWEV